MAKYLIARRKTYTVEEIFEVPDHLDFNPHALTDWAALEDTREVTVTRVQKYEGITELVDHRPLAPTSP